MSYLSRTTVSAWGRKGEPSIAEVPHETLAEMVGYLRFNDLTVSGDRNAKMPEVWVGRAGGASLSADEIADLRALLAQGQARDRKQAEVYG